MRWEVVSNDERGMAKFVVEKEFDVISACSGNEVAAGVFDSRCVLKSSANHSFSFQEIECFSV